MEYFVQQLINGLTLGSIYGLIAIGYTMVFGIIGMVNFAHGDVFMVSAFIALILFLILTQILGVTAIGIPLDQGGMKIEALEAALKDFKARGVTPKFIYTIPTVQNPTATILDEDRRARILALADAYGVPIVEDDC